MTISYLYLSEDDHFYFYLGDDGQDLTLYVLYCDKGNIKIHWHFISILHTDMTQVAEILPHVRQGNPYSR